MLKKIEVDQLRLGMHLHAFDGPWMDHPFWRTKFVIDDDADLVRVRASGIKQCWIDVSRGLDVVAARVRHQSASSGPDRPVPVI